MTTNATTQPWRKTLARSAVSRSAGLLILGVVGWLWLPPAGASPWPAVTLAAVLTLAALAGTAWHLARARAEGRWWAAWDRYAELELAQGTHRRRDPRVHPQPRGR